MAYKRDVGDIRESPALDITRLLLLKGARISYHDPHVPSVEEEGVSLRSATDLVEALKASDCVVVATDHSAYDWDVVRLHGELIMDTRQALGAAAR